MERRDFLRTAGMSALGSALPAWVRAAVPAAHYDRLLILIELKGGNDGLNTVVPFSDPAYYALRPKLAVARDQVLQLDERAGLHPALQPLLTIWQSGELGILRGVGYPAPNLSHFRSIEIWDTASRSDQYLQDGWLARAFVQVPPPASFSADGVVIGSSDTGPLSGSGARVLALANPEQFLRQARLASAETEMPRSPALAHVLKVEADIVQAAGHLGSTLAKPRAFQIEFPKGPFGQSVHHAAQIVSGSGVAALRLTLSGFDTHHNQPGTQANLLGQLAEGLVALRGALKELGRWNDSLILTYAEFGRRPKENLSNGTDHGTANAHFVLGGRVRGGLYGRAPDLAGLDGNGNLPFAVDFRSLYATVLDRWWGVPAQPVLGGRFEPLDLLRT